MTTKITTDNILDGTIDSVDIKNSSIDLSSSKVTGSVPTANLPTIPVSKGGTGLTSLGSAGEAIKVNSGASALEFGSGGKILQWVRNGSLTNINTTTSVTDYKSMGSMGTITPLSNDSIIYVTHNMFVLPYHSSGTSPQIGLGFQMYDDSGLSSVLSGTYGSTHTVYYQGSTTSHYIYLPLHMTYAYSTSSTDGHPGAGVAKTYYHGVRSFNTSGTLSLRVNQLQHGAYIVEVA